MLGRLAGGKVLRLGANRTPGSLAMTASLGTADYGCFVESLGLPS
jgi:hypothetical protein